MDQMNDYLCVGLGIEPIASTDKLIAKTQIIFDNPIMNERDISLWDMRVRILLAWLAMSGPTRMRYPYLPHERPLGHRLF